MTPPPQRKAEVKRAELDKIERQLQKLLDALLDDGDSKTIVENMQALEVRQEALEAELSQADSPPPLAASQHGGGLTQQDQ